MAFPKPTYKQMVVHKTSRVDGAWTKMFVTSNFWGFGKYQIFDLLKVVGTKIPKWWWKMVIYLGKNKKSPTQQIQVHHSPLWFISTCFPRKHQIAAHCPTTPTFVSNITMGTRAWRMMFCSDFGSPTDFLDWESLTWFTLKWSFPKKLILAHCHLLSGEPYNLSRCSVTEYTESTWQPKSLGPKIDISIL